TGPYEPAKVHRFNPHKIVLDPYAKAVGRDLTWSDSLFGYRIGDPAADLSVDPRDNAAVAPLAAVVRNGFRWGNDRRPQTPWHQTLIYELHVKGYSYKSPWVPQELRGTYAGLACEGSLRHLRSLGATAIELLPVHQRVEDRFLVEKNL